MSSAPSDEIDAALATISWEDRRWWTGGLRRETAIDYFACSPFYERTCLNEQLKMQRNLAPETVQERLQQDHGIVYELDEERTDEVPPSEHDSQAHTLYVIRKLHRSQSGKETPLRYYYVLDGVRTPPAPQEAGSLLPAIRCTPPCSAGRVRGSHAGRCRALPPPEAFMACS